MWNTCVYIILNPEKKNSVGKVSSFYKLKAELWVHCLLLFALVFRKNVTVTCKIVSFSCGSDNFLLKKLIVFNFGKVHLKKGSIFDPFFTFFTHQEKNRKKNPSAHILHKKHIFSLPFWSVLPYQFCKKYQFILYGFSLVHLLVWILICAILEHQWKTKWWAKFKLACLTIDINWRALYEVCLYMFVLSFNSFFWKGKSTTFIFPG